MKYIISTIVVIYLFFYTNVVFGALSCSITTAASCTSPSVIVLRMSSSTNAHSELPNQSNGAYSNSVICCSGSTGMTNACTGTFQIVARLSSTTNAQVEQSTLSNYTNNTCLAVTSGSVSIGYQDSNCTGFDTSIASISSSTNAHVGGAGVYTRKICGSLTSPTQAITFNISNNSIGFGNLTSLTARYATANNLGTSTEAEAHQITASTNAGSGYTVTVQGPTLTSGSNTVSAIGSTNTPSSVGTEQFGLRMTATGGSGIVSTPYSGSGFAYSSSATTTTSAASAASGDGVTTTYSVRYIGNISGNTKAGTYTSNIVYVATANY